MAIARERLTEEQFMQVPEDGYKHELVDGEDVKVPTSGKHDEIIMELSFRLRPLLSGRGAMSCGQSGFRMANGNIRVPDLSFTSRSRLPEGKPSDGFNDGAPDFCVEVISPSERQPAILDKVAEYFESGARVVWLIIPETRSIIVYRSDVLETQTYREDEEIDLPEVTPGFRCRAGDLFATV